MAFSNVQVDIDSLPRAAALQLERLPEAHRREILVQGLITLAILATPALAFALLRSSIGLPFWLAWTPVLIVLLSGAPFLALALVRYRFKGYALREHDIAFRTGLFWRKTTLLPFDRVQHAEVTQGPLQRRFDLATLKFYTAGGSSVDLKIDGLHTNQAERLRTRILERAADA